MSYPVVKDIIHRIQNSEGYCLNVRPHPDNPDWVTLTNVGDRKSKEMLGEIDVPMEPAFARLVGKALIECANECERSEND